MKSDSNTIKDKVLIKYVSEIPDLITYKDIQNENKKKKVKIQIELTENGIEIIGDSPYDQTLEDLLINSGAKEIQQVLCG